MSTPVHTDDAGNVDPLDAVGWRALVACEAWDRAAAALDALSVAARDRSEVRLGRARAAVGRCTVIEGERALTELTGLDGRAAVARVADVIAPLRVDALVCARRFEEALGVPAPHGLRARAGGGAARTLARALEAVGDVAGARVALGRAIDGGERAGIAIAPLLVWRARLAQKMGDEKAEDADQRRLFVEFPVAWDEAFSGHTGGGHPAGAPGAGYAGALARVPKLDVDGWLRRAHAWASAGRPNDALRAIDDAGQAGGEARRLARARGSVLYKAKAYTRAALALTEAARLGPSAGDEASIEDDFHAARATSRAGLDAPAIVAYERLAKAHPSSRWGAEAAWLAAHLRYLNAPTSGKWNEAIDGLDRYLASASARVPGQTVNVREAKRARAIALLEVGGRAGDARAAFRALAASDDYARDGFARARLEFLGAVATERMGERASATAAYVRLATEHPYGWIAIAARRRLGAFGEATSPSTAPSQAPWPGGPIRRGTPPTFSGRVGALHEAGLDRDALAAFLQDASSGDAERCAVFDALQAGAEAYRLGLHLATSASPDWRWRCGWPTPHEEIVAALEAREALPRGILHAIVRQESGFALEVVSPAGAIGMAQLMPFTAATIAATIGVRLDPADVTTIESPFLQLDLAARHLADVYREFDVLSADAKLAAAPLAIAAYNAGAGAVKRWVAEAGPLDAEVFIERIPFLETRGYVTRVMGNFLRYAILAGAPTPTLPARFTIGMPPLASEKPTTPGLASATPGASAR